MDFVAVHVGAGSHNQKNEKLYFDLCNKACNAGIEAFQCDSDPIDAVSRVVEILEDSELTNAGCGSNLCWDGSVECDASIMSGWNMRWSGVGAMSGIKNPISVAKELHCAQGEKKLCGLVPPLLLTGRGAADWASSRGFQIDTLLTNEKSLNRHKYYKRKYEQVASIVSEESAREPRLDTIGAIVVSRSGQTASAVSSGGLTLKTPGRIGQAAIFGAGCWAQDGFASTTTGTGEQLIKTNFARSLTDCLVNVREDENVHSAAERAFNDKFLSSPLLQEIDEHNRMAGFLAVVRDPATSRLEIVCGHNTPSMVYSFRSSKARESSNFFSKFIDGGADVKIQCHLICQ